MVDVILGNRSGERWAQPGWRARRGVAALPIAFSEHALAATIAGADPLRADASVRWRPRAQAGRPVQACRTRRAPQTGRCGRRSARRRLRRSMRGPGGIAARSASSKPASGPMSKPTRQPARTPASASSGLACSAPPRHRTPEEMTGSCPWPATDDGRCETLASDRHAAAASGRASPVFLTRSSS
jgi:hypothetical protein